MESKYIAYTTIMSIRLRLLSRIRLDKLLDSMYIEGIGIAFQILSKLRVENELVKSSLSHKNSIYDCEKFFS